ncbi:hypothetical protein ACET3Z_000531 [Daucus carota]
MTYEVNVEEGGQIEVNIDELKGEYVNMREVEGQHGQSEGGVGSNSDSMMMTSGRWWCLIWWWAKLILLILFLGVLAAVFFKWVGPFFMDKEIVPILNWETTTFSKPVLAAIVFASVALFPVIFLPSTPSMWVAGMTFGYGYGFLLIIGGVTIGVSLPYFIGLLFHNRMQEWLQRYPKKARVIKLAGEGNQVYQFQAVTLIRISPFPYIVFNYCAVATNVKYIPYLLGSMVGMVPEILVAIYTGIMIKTLADASTDQRTLSTTQIIFNVCGFCLTVTTTVIITIYAKRRLKELQMEEEPLLQ